jgi:3-hydroxyacyl-CoA dehydrogenase
MGHSIAGVFALAGATVSVYDTVQPMLDSVPDRVAEQLERRGARTLSRTCTAPSRTLTS